MVDTRPGDRDANGTLADVFLQPSPYLNDRMSRTEDLFVFVITLSDGEGDRAGWLQLAADGVGHRVIGANGTATQ